MKTPNLYSHTHLKFMNNVITDDLLIEILIRVQIPKFLIPYSIVNKRWLSLISDPRFISIFIHQHHQKSQLNNANQSSNYHSQPHKVLLQNLSSFLDFLPDGPRLQRPIVGLSLGRYSFFKQKFLYICNSLTRQWLPLPKLEVVVGYQRFGLIYEPSSCDERLGCINTLEYRLRVVLVNNFYRLECIPHNKIDIFCSETWKMKGARRVIAAVND
ncbi:F-box domain containing protein [Parasponia andersonii]|uniref:F-box domain containing protein n=1 Tax=Parasponia andersonii TaxID=3476 RepID=A0A2P5BVS7_PARAD|nr:F-box domain containing protein [Parasponia andersonii]